MMSGESRKSHPLWMIVRRGDAMQRAATQGYFVLHRSRLCLKP
jgi:hypothetical protein